MVEQQGFEFDPMVHTQPPPVVPLRPEVQAPRPQQPPRQAAPPGDGVPTPQLVEMAKAVSRIVATRVLLLIVVITACLIWMYTAWQPTELRIAASGVFTVLSLWPLTWLYYRKG